MLTFPSFLLRFFFIHILIFYSILGSFSSLFMPFFTCLNSYVVFILFEVINHSYSWILKLLCKFLFIFEVFKFSSWGDIFKAHASWLFHVSCVSALLFVLFFFFYISLLVLPGIFLYSSLILKAQSQYHLNGRKGTATTATMSKCTICT